MRVQEEKRKVRLEYHSEQFARKLLLRHPEWKQYAGHYEQIEDAIPTYYLDVNVPPANPRVPRPFRIYTRPDQDITITWVGEWHLHFDPWPKNVNSDNMEKALEAIGSLVSDRLVIGAMYRDGRVGSVWSSEVGSELPEWLVMEKGGHVELRSWLGTYDRDIDWSP